MSELALSASFEYLCYGTTTIIMNNNDTAIVINYNNILGLPFFARFLVESQINK